MPRAVIPDSKVSLKSLAHSRGVRAIHYDDGGVRIRSPQGHLDFSNVRVARAYLKTLPEKSAS